MPAPSRHVLPYLVRRSARGSLPVYSDLRNAGTRRLVLVTGVLGSVDCLARDLRQSLFPPGSPHAHRLAVKVHRQRHLAISGGPFKRDVVAWLAAKGF